METCVLVPRDLSLILSARKDSAHVFEMGVTVWANRKLYPGTIYRPDEGDIRLDKLEVYSCLKNNNIRFKFGCFDDVIEIDNQEVRHCNWVRFVQSSTNVDDVNVVATKVDGRPVFQVVKNVPPNGELKVFFDCDTDDSLTEEEAVCEAKDLSISPTRPTDLSTSLETTHSSDTASSPLASPLVTDEELRSSSDRDSTATKQTPSPLYSPKDSFLSDEMKSPESTTEVSPGGELNRRHSRHEHDIGFPLALPLRRKEKTWLPCEVCGKKFDRPSLLKRHMRTHTGEKPHACDVCGKAFSTSSSLNTHRRIHSGEKPHQCPICGKRFTASSNLYYHRMTHRKEKPHKCTMCSKSFPTPGDLKSHMYVHNGSWPFKCEICQRGFSKQTNLKNHMLLHTGDKPHECRLCGKKFALQCNLKTHLKTHEDEPQQRCLRCGKNSCASKQFMISGLCSECHQASPTEGRHHILSPTEGRHQILSPADTRHPIVSPTDIRHTVNPFSIDSLVSTKDISPVKTNADTPMTSIGTHPYYSNATMSAGILHMPPAANSLPYGLMTSWQRPFLQQYGIPNRM